MYYHQWRSGIYDFSLGIEDTIYPELTQMYREGALPRSPLKLVALIVLTYCDDINIYYNVI